jgi:outer membrane lipoprotein-sorting protein
MSGGRMIQSALPCLLALAAALWAAPTTAPATSPATDPALWKRMVEIDARGAEVRDLTADFEQRKFTALLRKPLVSSGAIRVRGSAMRWDTQLPEPTVLAIDEKEVRLYYPRQKTLEVYAIDQRFSSLAASPLPRLEVLRRFFSFERIAVKSFESGLDETSGLALRLTPINQALGEHIEAVRVLLEVKTGLIQQAETIDVDGDRTLLVFSRPRTNTGLEEKDVRLEIPAGVKVSRPLQGLEGQAPPARRGAKP